MKNRSRAVAAGVAILAGLALTATPALAHVTVNPGEASKGGFAKLTFRVPNERDDSGTMKVEIEFPADHPITKVSVKPEPGWTYTVERSGVDDAVSKITWEGGPIGPGEFGEFDISAGPLPDADQVIFKALQTYESGEIVRWIEEPNDDGSEPEFPAPVLTLVEGSGGHHGGGTDEMASDEVGHDEAGHDEAGHTETAADESISVAAEPMIEPSDETGLAASGVGIGIVALILGAVALLRTRRS